MVKTFCIYILTIDSFIDPSILFFTVFFCCCVYDWTDQRIIFAIAHKYYINKISLCCTPPFYFCSIFQSLFLRGIFSHSRLSSSFSLEIHQQQDLRPRKTNRPNKKNQTVARSLFVFMFKTSAEMRKIIHRRLSFNKYFMSIKK